MPLTLLICSPSVFANVCSRVASVSTTVKRTYSAADRLAAGMPLRAPFAALALLLLGAPAARADGDPASDVLPEQPVFYGSALDLKSKPAAQLDALARLAKSKGYDINVAVISRLEDMGSATQFWGDMDNYGEFLAGEIGCCIKGRLLIVMPAGLGVTYLGHSSTADRQVLAGVPAPGEVDKLLPAAMDAVVKLAAASGVSLAVPDVTPAPDGVSQPATHAAAANVSTAGGGSRSGGSGGWLLLLPILAVVFVALAIVARRRMRPRVEGG